MTPGRIVSSCFMDFQILEPFDPEFPTTSGLGAPEVPIVDVDINPDPGHTNPYRKGANRNAKKRHYHLEFDLKAILRSGGSDAEITAPAARRLQLEVSIESGRGGNGPGAEDHGVLSTA